MDGLEDEAFDEEFKAPEETPMDAPEETSEDRPPSRRSFYEDDKAEMSMIAAELDEADQFNLTIEYVDKPMEADDDNSPPGSTKSSDDCDTESSDEKIELDPEETRISPASIAVGVLKKPLDKRKSLAKELLSDWKTPAPAPARASAPASASSNESKNPNISRKRESDVIVHHSTPKRRVLAERRSLNL